VQVPFEVDVLCLGEEEKALEWKMLNEILEHIVERRFAG
jgi:hypothetical protein